MKKKLTVKDLFELKGRKKRELQIILAAQVQPFLTGLFYIVNK